MRKTIMKTRPGAEARRRRQRGNAVIEAALMGVWVFFLFVGILDFGFYNHALITTENAARVAAHYAAQSAEQANDFTNVCRIVRAAMNSLPNTHDLGTCATSASGISDSIPLAVITQDVPSPGGPAGDEAAQVTVIYRTMRMIPLPMISGQLTIRTVKEMKMCTDC